MSANSKIEWTNRTWNPVTGCTKVSAGCKNCYAERMFARLTKNPVTPAYHGREFTDVRCHEDLLDKPLHWRKPQMVFVNSMSDLFHPSVPFEFVLEVIHKCWQASQHTYQILTKRPERVIRFLDWLARENLELRSAHGSLPKNIWLGVSVEDQATADERIPQLLQIPATVRFVSAEPLLGLVNLSKYLTGERHDGDFCDDCQYKGKGKCKFCDASTFIHWLIVGGESGPKARPMHPDWVRSLRDQAVAAEVPFFMKQWGEWIFRPTPHSIPANAKKIIPSTGGCYYRIGKKAAGRMLDGELWDEYPEVRA